MQSIIGAAGTIAANLKALGVDKVDIVGFCGDDGEGYELRRAMVKLNLMLEGFFSCPDRFTPTYGKPCYIDSETEDPSAIYELERLDIKNRRSMPVPLQKKMMAYIRNHLDIWDGLVIVDQVSTPNCGVLTSRLRRFLIDESRRRPDLPFLVDSREHIHLFKHMILKPNQFGAARAVTRGWQKPTLKASTKHAHTLSAKACGPVFLTLAEGHARRIWPPRRSRPGFLSPRTDRPGWRWRLRICSSDGFTKCRHLAAGSGRYCQSCGLHNGTATWNYRNGTPGTDYAAPQGDNTTWPMNR